MRTGKDRRTRRFLKIFKKYKPILEQHGIKVTDELVGKIKVVTFK